jgi:RNA polymerase sigma factor (sigma-70 family)
MATKRRRRRGEGFRDARPVESELPRLSREDENQLVTLAQAGSVKAMQHLVNRNYPFIVYMASEYRRHFAPRCGVDECISLAAEGYIKAIYKHDVEGHADVSLAHYSEYYIANAFRRAVRHNRSISIPDYLFDKKNATHRLRADAERARYVVQGCAMGVDDDDEEAFEPFVDKSGYDEAKVREIDYRDSIELMMGRIPERERGLLTLYYTSELPFSECANRMGISAQRVAQIHDRAIRRLQEAFGTRTELAV